MKFLVPHSKHLSVKQKVPLWTDPIMGNGLFCWLLLVSGDQSRSGHRWECRFWDGQTQSTASLYDCSTDALYLCFCFWVLSHQDRIIEALHQDPTRMWGHRNEVSDFDIICVGSNWDTPYVKEPILPLRTGEYRQVFHVSKPRTEVIQELLDDFGPFLWDSRVTNPAHLQANSSPTLLKGASSWHDAQWPSLRSTITVSPETKAEFYWIKTLWAKPGS